MNDTPLPQRKCIRLKDYDYSQNGYYFVTICTQNRRCLLSQNKEDITLGQPTVGNAVPGVPNIAHNQTDINNVVLFNGECISSDEFPSKMYPTQIGCCVINAWRKMSQIHDNIKTDLFCLMPNHIHGIIIIQNQEPDVSDAERRGLVADNNVCDQSMRPGRRSLQDVVRALKSVTTRQYNEITNDNVKNDLWQSSFYDQVIRDEKTLSKIREYIQLNPCKWLKDKYFVE